MLLVRSTSNEVDFLWSVSKVSPQIVIEELIAVGGARHHNRRAGRKANSLFHYQHHAQRFALHAFSVIHDRPRAREPVEVCACLTTADSF